ncbi:MAG: hypothetical protein J6U04_12510 [Salinivirgaceae bacterium]|nr:hypothetical protein [Salinivirgaceae bacterium]
MIIRTLSILILLIATLGTQAQQQNATSPIWLKTDRCSYVSGDNVLFSLFMLNDTAGSDVNIDLRDVNGNWITGCVTRHSGSAASGLLNIPDTLLTGYYNIRAYTCHPNTDNYYCSREILVINRFGNEPNHIFRNSNSKKEQRAQSGVIRVTKTDFATREKVEFALSCPDSVSGTLRIVKRNQWSDETAAVTGKCEPININEGYTHIAPYDGILVAGTVTDSVSGKLISDAIVLISLQDSIIRLKYDITDADGSFCVLLHNYYGQQQIFANAFSPRFEPLFNARIELKSQFNVSTANAHDLVEAYPVTDSTELDKAVIAKAFEIQPFAPVGISNRPETLYDHFILGTPRHTVFTDDFIELNNFKEITRELTPFIRLRKGKNGEPELRIVSDNGGVTSNPLLLVDGVPLTNLNLLMDKGSATIKRVDTQNKPRNFGNISFGNGIVAVWTHKLDFWEKCHVPGTYSFVVQGFEPPIEASAPKPSKDKLPNLQQTVYWNPSIAISGQQNIEAQLSDETGEFVIEFFGIDRNGKIVSDYKLINVK